MGVGGASIGVGVRGVHRSGSGRDKNGSGRGKRRSRRGGERCRSGSGKCRSGRGKIRSEKGVENIVLKVIVLPRSLFPSVPPSLPPLTHELLDVLMLRPLQEQRGEGAEHRVMPEAAHGGPEDGGEAVGSQEVPLQEA